MPKDHSDYPINMTFRVSITQRDYLDEVASLHKITPSDYLRALLDAALVAGEVWTRRTASRRRDGIGPSPRGHSRG